MGGKKHSSGVAGIDVDEVPGPAAVNSGMGVKKGPLLVARSLTSYRVAHVEPTMAVLLWTLPPRDT